MHGAIFLSLWNVGHIKTDKELICDNMYRKLLSMKLKI